MDRNLVVLLIVILIFSFICLGEPQWIKGDSHLHTLFSDGAGTPAQTVATAKELGYKYATLTDHNTVTGNASFEALSSEDFIGLGGEEVTRGDGHILAYGIDSYISAGGSPQQSINSINSNNPGKSFCYLAHPMWSVYTSVPGDWEWHDWSVTGYSGLEVWNAYYPQNYNKDYNIAAFNKWDELNNNGMHLYGITNSDAHTSKIGDPSGYPLGLGYGWTTVYSELIKDSILNALKIGRHYGSNGPIIDFKINDKMMGSDVYLINGKLQSVYLYANDDEISIQTVKLIKNGQVFQTWQPNLNEWTETLEDVEAEGGDFFRITAEGTSRFAYSNPIFVASGPATIENPYSSGLKKLNTIHFNNRRKSLILNFSLSKENTISLFIYSLSGQRITTLINNRLLKPVKQNLICEVKNIASGSYIIKINIGNSTVIKKISFLN